MAGVALHGLHQVGDQVVALFQLHVDVGEGLVGFLVQRHQLVVGADDEKQQYDDDDADDDPGDHEVLLVLDRHYRANRPPDPNEIAVRNGNVRRRQALPEFP